MRSRAHEQTKVSMSFFFISLAREDPKSSTMRFWLCYHEPSFFPVGLSSCCVTYNPLKKINLRDNLNFGSLSKHPRKQALTLLLTLTCLHVPLGCTAFRAQDCPPLWNSESMAVQAPRNELRTPGRKRTDHVFLGKSLTQTSMSSSEKLLSLSQNWHERQTTSYPWMWSARHSTNVTYIHI